MRHYPRDHGARSKPDNTGRKGSFRLPPPPELWPDDGDRFAKGFLIGVPVSLLLWGGIIFLIRGLF